MKFQPNSFFGAILSLFLLLLFSGNIRGQELAVKLVAGNSTLHMGGQRMGQADGPYVGTFFAVNAREDGQLLAFAASASAVEGNPANAALSEGLVPDAVEYEALVALYNSTDGANWTNNTNWLVGTTSADFANWYGVSVENGDVAAVNLQGNGLAGSLPPELGNLRFHTCHLDNNSLKGSIPKEFGGTEITYHLKSLSLANNMLEGILPVGFSNHRGIHYFNLENNNFEGYLRLSTSLELEGNQLHINIKNNKFNGIPRFLKSYSLIQVQNNKLEFNEFERYYESPGVVVYNQTLELSPQKKIGEPLDIYIQKGKPLDLSISTYGQYNLYQWEKFDGTQWQAISGATAATYAVPAVAFSDAGTYRCVVTNEMVTGLTLYTYDYKVIVSDIALEATDVAVCENSPATLNAEGEGLISWYDAPTEGTLLATGNTFVTQPITQNTTFYVEDEGGGARVAAQANILNGAFQRSFTDNEGNGIGYYDAKPLADGGFIAVGTHYNNTTSYDLFFARFDLNGSLIWSKKFETPGYDRSPSVAIGDDGGFVCVWMSGNYGNENGAEVFILKATSDGVVENVITSASVADEEIIKHPILKTSDGDFVIGYQSFNITREDGSKDASMVLTKISGNGQLLWRKQINASNAKSPDVYTIEEVQGGYVTGGYLNGNNLFIVKTDFNGNVLWTREYNCQDPTGRNFGQASDDVHDIKQTSDGGLIMVGSTLDVGNSSIPREWYMYVMKTDAIGRIEWIKMYDQPGMNGDVFSILTVENGYIVAHRNRVSHLGSSGEVISSKAISGIWGFSSLIKDNIGSILAVGNPGFVKVDGNGELCDCTGSENNSLNILSEPYFKLEKTTFHNVGSLPAGSAVLSATDFEQVLRVGCAPPPVPEDVTICSGETATLTAQAEGTIRWYSAQTEGELLYTGPTYTTPALSHTDMSGVGEKIYYVSQEIAGTESERNAVKVTINPKPLLSDINYTPTSCSTARDGAIRLVVHYFTSGFSYELARKTQPYMPISSGSYTGTGVSNLEFDFYISAQDYILKVTDDNGCVTTQELSVPDGSPLISVCAANRACEATAGEVSLTIEATAAREQTNTSYTFNILNSTQNEVIYSGSGNFSLPQQVLIQYDPAYTYSVEYTGGGDYACESSSQTIHFPETQLSATLSEPDGNYYQCTVGQPMEVGIQASLELSSCASATTAFSYALYKEDVLIRTETGEAEHVFTVAETGAYRVEVSNTDYNCQATATFQVLSSGLEVSLDAEDVSCAGELDGRATARASGGIPPYSYAWYDSPTATEPFSTLSTAEGLSAGTFYLEVSDSKSCSQPQWQEVYIYEPYPLGALTVNLPAATSCEASVSMSLPGGDAPYLFKWYKVEEVEVAGSLFNPAPTIKEVKSLVFSDDNPLMEATQVTSFSDPELVLPGIYEVEVVDANGCSTRTSPYFEILSPDVPREYLLCFGWETRVIENTQEESDISSINLSTINAATQMRQSLQKKTQKCLTAAGQSVQLNFLETCLNLDLLEDEVNLQYVNNQYHFTLYYYDRAGRLLKTVAPEQVVPLTENLSRTVKPDFQHTFATTYNYNSLGQLVAQTSPDGQTSRFIYNKMGQLRFSQNAQQALDGAFSYTKYDALSRIIEVGEASLGVAYEPTVGESYATATFEDLKAITVLDARDYLELGAEARYPVAAHTLRQVSSTVYTTPAAVSYEGMPQRYLLNRVSYTSIDTDGDALTTDDRSTTYYSYDPHGNVAWMVQEIPGLEAKTLAYEYDLISGNVLQVKYNEEGPDRFFHRYTYDSDNRIEAIYTSTNGRMWERDAKYEYYAHGPLKRTVVGEDQVQGLDYVYTIHGWLKAINSPDLQQAHDPGQDGLANAVGRDVFGMILSYYANDYTNSNSQLAAAELQPAANRSLYNGNIAAWTTNIADDDGLNFSTNKVFGRQFSYDKLNRLKESTTSESADGGLSWNSSDLFGSAYTYDGNGNILSLNRYAAKAGVRTQIDALNYQYNSHNNQLRYITDAIAANVMDDDATVPDEDVNDQSAFVNEAAGEFNYEYDAIGNLVRDRSEGIAIDWTVYGKVAQVEKEDGSLISFGYDAAGNRVKKAVTSAGGIAQTTYYVRDASGNIMAVYENRPDALRLIELPLYGSDRLGVYEPQLILEGGAGGSRFITEDLSLSAYAGVSYQYGPGVQISLEPGFVFEATEAESFFIEPGEGEIPPVEVRPLYARVLGLKRYELKDHLGNVRVTLSDRLLAYHSEAGGDAKNGIYPEIRSFSNYYPFGMQMPGRNRQENYRYGFNGKEHDKEWGGSVYDYGFRIYNPRIAKFMSVDPLTKEYPWYTPYQFAGNKPIRFIDLDGLEEYDPMSNPVFIARLTLTAFYDLKHAWYNTALRVTTSDVRARYKEDEKGNKTFETEFYSIDDYSLSGFGKELANGVLDAAGAAGGIKPDATDVLAVNTGSRNQLIRAVRNFTDPSEIVKQFQREGDFGGTINLLEGNSKKGLKHILERHSADEFLNNTKGDLFPSGTADNQLFDAIQEIYSKGTRVSDVDKAVQTFEKRIKINGESGNYRLIIDNKAKEVVTFFKIGGTE